MTIYLSVIVEDELSAAAVRKLVAHASPEFVIKPRPLVKSGVGNIRRDMEIFRRACSVLPHLVVADLDAHECPVAALRSWKLTARPDNLLVRFAVRETEAWLLADRAGIAGLLNVPEHLVPARPEGEADPKATLLNLAKKGKRHARDLLPAKGSSCKIGPLYNEVLGNFVTTRWDIETACANADSLNRALRRLRELAAR